MSSQNPNRSLSSAAAAAALRARPHTPTNVGAVQTKRTMRRSPSISSVSSAPAGGRRTPKLERRGSSGSMTERTFRSPSPHGREPQGQNQYPPVPAIPDGHRNSTVGRSPSTVGVGMQNFRTASQKMDTELPSWYTKPSGDTSNVRTSDAPMGSAGKSLRRPESLIAAGRPDSQNSVNFSYPSRHRATSPSPSPTADRNPQWGSLPPNSIRASLPASFSNHSDQAMVYDPNSRRMVPRTDQLDLMEVKYHTREASEKQPKKKKGVQRSGSHLAKGTVARVKGTTIEPSEQEHDSSNRSSPALATPPNGRNVPTGGQSLAEVNPTNATSSHLELAEPSRDQQSQSEVQDMYAKERTAQVAEAPSNRLVGRKPSVVRELPEEDAKEPEEPMYLTSKTVRQALDSVPTQQNLFSTPEDSGEPSSSGCNEPPTRSDFPEEVPAEQKVAYIPNKPVAELSRNGSISRSASNSPARTARFATTPSESLAVRHAPLPRSASPIKSALKHYDSSARDASLSDNGSDMRVTSPEREASIARKKSARVSFDDHNTKIVGEAAPTENEDSPVAPSPQHSKRPWYSHIARSKKKDISLDEDEIMKPRPALPSFGSVREKKLREPEEERPLIRPSGSAYSSATPSSPLMRPSSGGITALATTPDSPSVGQSNDHAMGFIISQDQSSRNAANISRFREPLPPVVTTAEAHRYDSDSASSYSEDKLSNDEMSGGSDAEAIPSTQTTMADSYDHMRSPPAIPDKSASRTKESHAELKSAIELPDNQVPAISITNPSPAILDGSHPSESASNLQQYFEVPGTFPDEEVGEDRSSKQTTTKSSGLKDVTRSARSIVEPKTEVPTAQIDALPQTSPSGVPTAADVTDSADDESNASIYSDAYEELSDIEGDGYQSLNAVVESPLSKKPAAAPIESLGVTKPDSTEAMGDHMLEKVIKDAEDSTEPTQHIVNDWETAKSYWRSLTTEKRRQLEREAMLEAGDDADAETPTRRPSNRKKTPEQIKATSVAQMAQAQAPAHGNKHSQPSNPERVYMIQPGTKDTQEPYDPPPPPSARMRTSLRPEQPAKQPQGSRTPSGGVHLRKSMRGMTTAEETTGSGASRRVSAPPERPASMSKTTLRPQTAAPGRKAADSSLASTSAGNATASAAKPALQRRGSDASDSSFKRSRAPSSGGFGFRNTMRQPPAGEVAVPAERSSGRFSIRSMSPPESPFRRGSSNATGGPPVTLGMRRTLRSNSESSQDSKRSSMQFPSFGRSNKASKASKKPKKTSRLRDDSSDDDSTVAPAFRSRFADSSDEDEPLPQPPTRPMSTGTLRGSATAPSRFQRSATVVEETEEAPELPDSGDDRSMQMPSPLRSPKSTALSRPMPQRQSSSGIGTSTLNRSGSGRARLTEPAYTSPESPKNRRSFMDNILRRNKKADQDGKIQRGGWTESAARRDTLLERDADELRDLRGDSINPGSPKLQKRTRPGSRNGSWPLPDVGDNGRPSTADGRVNGGPLPRPNIADRRSTSLGLPGVVGQPAKYDGKDVLEPENNNKKKKKFGALRRMFRLDD